MIRKPRILIVDPNLEALQGHYLGYAARLSKAAAALGLSPTIVANHAATFPFALDLRPALKQNYWQEMIPPQGTDPFDHLAMSARSFASSIRQMLIETDAMAGDVLFLPYANVAEALAMAQLGHFMADSLPRVTMLFRREIEEQGEDARIGRRTVATLLRQAVSDLFCTSAGSRVRLFTDSDELSSDYEEALGRRVQTAPIPVDPALRLRKQRPSATTLLYLGDARTEKGYLMLPALAHALSERLRAGKLQLVLQSNFNVKDGEAGIPQARETLSRIEGIRLLTEPLSEESYAQYLAESSLVLLPYTPSKYVARTSGILAEAIVAGVPAVVPSGTWLSRQVRHFGAGLSFNGSAEGLVRSVEMALGQLPILQEQAEDRSQPFAEFHNPNRLVQFVCGIEVLDRASRCITSEQHPSREGIALRGLEINANALRGGKA